MSGNNDAELSVGINDNVSPVLARMAAQVRAFGNSVGAEAKNIDKAVSQVTKSIHNLGTGPGVKSGSSHLVALRKQGDALTASLREQEAIMARLNRARSVTTDTNGNLRGADGKFISKEDVATYQAAARAAEDYRTRLVGLDETLRRNAAAESAASSAATLRAERIRSMGPSLQRENELLAMREHMLSNMGASMKRSWWPPDMLTSPQKFAETVAGMQNSVRYAMYDVSRNLAIGGVALTALGVGAVVAAATWERAFADVERTVQGTPALLAQIREGLVGLSQDIPVSFSQLSEIASIGGQMGISSAGIVQYTETIAKLTATTNLTADAASKALGRFKSFFAEANDPTLAVTDQTFSNLASSILKVGVNSVATESGIVNVATQISSMGKYAGFTADQVVGLAGALSSIGVPPELSRGVTTRLFTLMGEAVSEQGVRLQDFARIAGVSAAEFSAAWGTENFAYIFTDFIAGLNGITAGGGDAVTTLHELGITSVRDVPILQRLASAAGEAGTAGSLLAQTMNDARTGWRQNIELTLQYNKIADTLAERSKVLIQNFEALFATMGQSGVGPVKDMVNGLINLVKGFTELASTPAGQWLGGVAIAAGVLTGAILLLAAGGARAFAAMQGLAAGLSAVTGSAAAATAAVRVLGIATMAIGAVGAIAAVVGTIWALSAAADDATNSIVDTTGAVAAMQADAEAGYKGLFAIGEAGSEAAAGMEATATQADILSDITANTTDKVYGTGSALTDLGERSEQAAMTFGKSSRQFVQNALLANKAFTDLFAGDAGTRFGRGLDEAGFKLDTLIKRVAGGGKNAGSNYLESLMGVKPNTNVWDDISKSWIWMDQTAAQTARSTGDLLNQVNGTVEGMKAAGNAAMIAGTGMKTFESATQITEDALADFQVQNEDTINSMAEGFKEFVNTGTLIGLTQHMKEAFATLDDGETDINEHAEAIAGFEKAWEDAYGGASFSIEEYMTTFRRAAGEQQTFIAGLQELAARGVPTDIIGDLAAMGPQAQSLVEALISGTDEQLDEYVALYGSTGFEAMVAMAAGQLAAQQIVTNAAKTLSSAELRQLSADLAAGTPLTDAMKKWNLDAEGKPMKAPANAYLNPGWEWMFQNQMNRSNVTVPVTPYLTRSRIVAEGGIGTTGSTRMYAVATGGHITGPGTGTSDSIPAWLSNGEFVMTAKATRTIGVDNLYAMMRAAQSGRAPRRGFAAGGLVGGAGGAGSGTFGGIVHLSMEDRMLLMEIRDRVGITLGDNLVASLANSGNATSSQRRNA